MSGIDRDEGVLKRRTTKGPDLYVSSAMPSSGTKAVLGIVHGYADYGARYAHVATALAERGIGSVSIDYRGHGRAGGTRGYCDRFEDYLDDLREFRAVVQERAKGAPTFLFGHSLGGLVTTTSVLDDPSGWRGLLLSAPFFGLALDVPAAKIFAGKIASRVVPKLGLPSGLAGKDLTHDPAQARAYDTDPLIFKNATARWFTETAAAQARALADAPRLSLPLYVVFGDDDKVASLAAAKRVFDAAGSKDKTWDERPGLYHEVLNEPCWPELVDVMATWILAHV